MLAKFEQNQIIRTTQTFDLFDKNLYIMLTISEISLALFCKNNNATDIMLIVLLLQSILTDKIYEVFLQDYLKITNDYNIFLQNCVPHHSLHF